jgi:hypothetical protein
MFAEQQPYLILVSSHEGGFKRALRAASPLRHQGQAFRNGSDDFWIAAIERHSQYVAAVLAASFRVKVR